MATAQTEADNSVKMWQELVTKLETMAAKAGGESALDPKDQIVLTVARQYLVSAVTRKINQ